MCSSSAAVLTAGQPVSYGGVPLDPDDVRRDTEQLRAVAVATVLPVVGLPLSSAEEVPLGQAPLLGWGRMLDYVDGKWGGAIDAAEGLPAQRAVGSMGPPGLPGRPGRCCNEAAWCEQGDAWPGRWRGCLWSSPALGCRGWCVLWGGGAGVVYVASGAGVVRCSRGRECSVWWWRWVVTG
jgi:hypothetical protein